MKLAWKRLDGQSGHEAGRQLLASLFFEETGREMPQISYTDNGKPYFLDEDWHFSPPVKANQPSGIVIASQSAKVVWQSPPLGGTLRGLPRSLMLSCNDTPFTSLPVGEGIHRNS